MVEEAGAGEGHDQAILITGLDDDVIADGAAGLDDITDSTTLGAVDAVPEREESVGAEGDPTLLRQPFRFFRGGQALRRRGETS